MRLIYSALLKCKISLCRFVSTSKNDLTSTNFPSNKRSNKKLRTPEMEQLAWSQSLRLTLQQIRLRNPP
jgi:hypothetical protein